MPSCARRSAVSFGACARIRSDQDLLSWSHARKAPCCAQTARAHTSLSPAVAYMSSYTAHIQARACHHSRLHTSRVHRSRGALLRMERPHVRAPRSLLAPGRNVDHPGVTVCAPCAAMQCDTVLWPGALHSPLSLPPRRHGRSVGTRRCTVFSNFLCTCKNRFLKSDNEGQPRMVNGKFSPGNLFYYIRPGVKRVKWRGRGEGSFSQRVLFCTRTDRFESNGMI